MKIIIKNWFKLNGVEMISFKSFKLKINQNYSLIKIEKKLLDNYFLNQVLIINYESNRYEKKRILPTIEKLLKFKKLIFNIDFNENIQKFIKEFKNEKIINNSIDYDKIIFNNNNEFNFNILLDIDSNQLKAFDNYDQNELDWNKIINVNKLNILGGNNIDDDDDNINNYSYYNYEEKIDLEYINQYFLPKYLNYDANSINYDDEMVHMNYSPIFSSNLIGKLNQLKLNQICIFYAKILTTRPTRIFDEFVMKHVYAIFNCFSVISCSYMEINLWAKTYNNDSIFNVAICSRLLQIFAGIDLYMGEGFAALGFLSVSDSELINEKMKN
ncbi:hypothetical protein ACTFIY_000319 [Dictyostelium cf. discoideum]